MNQRTAVLLVTLVLLALTAPTAAAQTETTTTSSSSINNSTTTSMTTSTTTSTTTTTATTTPSSTTTLPDESNDSGNSSALEEARRSPTVAGDDDLHIVDYELEDGTMTVELYAEASAFITVSASPDTDGDLGTGYIEERRVKPRSFVTISITAPAETVTVMSSDSKRNGKFTQLDSSSGSLLTGPFDGTDVRDAAVGGALGVGVPVLYTAVRAKTGAAENPERVA